MARGIHESITLTEKAGKSQFMFAEPFLNLLKFNEKTLEITKNLLPNLGESLGSFLRGLNHDIVNFNFSLETFTIDCLK